MAKTKQLPSAKSDLFEISYEPIEGKYGKGRIRPVIQKAIETLKVTKPGGHFDIPISQLVGLKPQSLGFILKRALKIANLEITPSCKIIKDDAGTVVAVKVICLA